MLLDRDIYKTQNEICTLTGLKAPNLSRDLKTAEKKGHKMLIEEIEDIKLYHIHTLPDNIKKRFR